MKYLFYLQFEILTVTEVLLLGSASIQAAGHRRTAGSHLWNFVLMMKCNKARGRGEWVEPLAKGLSIPAS